ncbi:ribosomal protein L5 [Chloroherpeton thalassium ATCC 35110]|uniref:Large ribosomal subunit protein uL5 n=1 Tax=Chloroherpeton thalassium (strain ATCC 35110 / GB-78) TaxID=517418 RepID=B3QYD6_CHLT3|nr:50S ribosomal protein L5 [Chloroherpeton thalassium]ACF13564.1 ribosomal protein L5 [Chloroherpeton thalassium ATCC 35110]
MAKKQENKAKEEVLNLPVPKSRISEKYQKEVLPKLRQQFKYSNVMMVPSLKKISINIGVGAAAQDPKLLDNAVKELIAITGQKPEIRKAKKAISNFKLRAGQPIGCRVTLRKNRMYEFFDRLVALAIPRIRDFRGVSDSSFDGRGNYTLGIREQIIFPEIDIDKVPKITGMDITFVTSAKTDEEAYALLKELGMPFKKKD